MRAPVPPSGTHDLSKSPLHILTSMFFVMVLVLVGLLSTLLSTRTQADRLLQRSIQAAEAEHLVALYDETLTMSTLMAAETEDLGWERRYRRAEPKRDAAILQAKKLLGASITQKTDDANRALVAIETKAFDAIRQGDPQAARHMLYSPEYSKQKKNYAEGLKTIRALLQEIVTTAEKKTHRRNAWTLAIGALTLIGALVCWFWLYRTLQLWRATMLKNQKRVARNTLKIQRFNETLSKRVEERNLELGVFRKIVDQSPDCIMLIDGPTGQMIEANTATERSLEYSREELLTLTIEDIKGAPPRAWQWEKQMAIFRENGGGTFQEKHRRKDGTLTSVEVSAGFIENEFQEYVVFVARNIEDRLKLEQAQKEQTARCSLFRTIIEQSSDCIYIIDPARAGFLDANTPAYRNLGYTKEELLTKSVPEIEATLESLHQFNRLTEKIRASNGLRVNGTHIRKDGSTFPVDVSVNFVTLGEDERLVAIARDITRRIETEQRLRENEEMLRASQKQESLGRLAGGIAHEFNNILTGILGLGHLMRESPQLSESDSSDLDEIIRSGERGADLVKQILTYSGSFPTKMAPLFFSERIKSFQRILSASIGERISLVIDCKEDLPPVLGDIGKLEQVLLNLCLNARDAIEGSGKILLTLEEERVLTERPLSHGMLKKGDFIRMDIQDSGCGMSAEAISKIFEPFYTTKPQGQGTGLGLPVVYGIVQEHDGCIDVTSNPGKGTRFSLFLKAYATEKRSPALPPPSKTPIRRGQETLLVVDDCEAPRRVVVRSLRKLGYDVLSAKDPTEALAIFEKEKNRISLVALDVIMPVMSGHELYLKFIEQAPTLKVLFMSGYAGAKEENIIKRSGLPFLKKPFSPDEVGLRVRETLDASRDLSGSSLKT